MSCSAACPLFVWPLMVRCFPSIFVRHVWGGPTGAPKRKWALDGMINSLNLGPHISVPSDTASPTLLEMTNCPAKSVGACRLAAMKLDDCIQMDGNLPGGKPYEGMNFGTGIPCDLTSFSFDGPDDCESSMRERYYPLKPKDQLTGELSWCLCDFDE